MLPLRSKIASLREYLTPINKNSNFATTGEISPDEFVKAGDYLVYKFPTWQWLSAPEKLRKDFLPPDKQYLITKHVPSRQRCDGYLGILRDVQGNANYDEDEDDVDEDGWVKSKRIATKPDTQEVEVDGDEVSTANSNNRENRKISPSHDIEDIDDFVEEDLEDSEDDDGFQQLVEGNAGGDTLLRKYDLYITYSTSYRVPKLYLVGFSSNGIPLLPKQMFEDIAGDYRDKTATIESLPVSHNTMSVSIHPCRHASVMKVLMAHVKSKAKQVEPTGDGSAEEEHGIRVDQYLIVFLKFIASVTPGIEYDYTMDAL